MSCGSAPSPSASETCLFVLCELALLKFATENSVHDVLHGKATKYDKADKKEILFTGVSGKQHDHALHAVVFGPDGKLYFNFGNSGRQSFTAFGSNALKH